MNSDQKDALIKWSARFVLLALVLAVPAILSVIFPQQARQTIASLAGSSRDYLLNHGQTSPAGGPSDSATTSTSTRDAHNGQTAPGSNDDHPPFFQPPPPRVQSHQETSDQKKTSFLGIPIPPFFTPPPPPPVRLNRAHIGPVQFSKKTINHCPLYESIVELQDVDTFLDIGLPGNADRANDASKTFGDETFDKLVKRFRGAIVVNGTFFSKDDQKRVMGNMVARGEFLKYSQWENYGTTIGLRAGNKPEMITARDEGQPPWQDYWFSITCGPRLLKHGTILVQPELEGFADSHVLGVGPRTAIGFPRAGDKLYMVTFVNGLSLKDEARIMQELGCYEAMNMDGGASRALAHDDEIVMEANRPLTNVIVVYDSKRHAPDKLRQSWFRFQDGDRPKVPML